MANKKRLKRRLKNERSKAKLSHHKNIRLNNLCIQCIDCNQMTIKGSFGPAYTRRILKKAIRQLNKLNCLSKDEKDIKEIIE